MMTLADHAEAWARENGKIIPPRDTPEYEKLYKEWHAWAFRAFGTRHVTRRKQDRGWVA